MRLFIHRRIVIVQPLKAACIAPVPDIFYYTDQVDERFKK